MIYEVENQCCNFHLEIIIIMCNEEITKEMIWIAS